MSVMDFLVGTYEDDIRDRVRYRGDVDGIPEVDDDERDESHPQRRARHTRSRYRSGHPNAETKHRVKRGATHRNLPNFVGRWFPSSSDPSTHAYYCASMLMLLKPWRDVRTDLKNAEESWSSAFERFVGSSPMHVRRAISGIQYYHSCKDAATEARNDDELPEDDFMGAARRYGNGGNEDLELAEDVEGTSLELTREGLAELIASQTPYYETVHAQHAICVAESTGVFDDTATGQPWEIAGGSRPISNATGGDLVKLTEWRAQMADDVQQQNALLRPPAERSTEVEDVADARVEQLSLDGEGSGEARVGGEPFVRAQAEGRLAATDPAILRDDQYRAYDIINWHVLETIRGNNPPQLRMIVHGEGGAGKSMVIQTATEIFEQHDVLHWLMKSAYTGVAASVIDGKTTHAATKVSVKDAHKVGDKQKADLQHEWGPRKYLVLDELSMLGKEWTSLMSRNVDIGKQGSDDHIPDAPFGGVNVILCGDLHQFPPVAKPTREYLYHPTRPEDPVLCKLGRAIWEKFDVVVLLKEQMRVVDPVWREFLVHLRRGEVQQRHLDMLRGLVLQPGEEQNIDFSEGEWAKAMLVTPRHAVRVQWNAMAARKACRAAGERLFICPAEDRVVARGAQPRELTLAEEYAVAARMKTDKRRRRQDLPATVELARGMKVLVTTNLETDLDVTNGARAVIEDIILHADEPPIGEGSEVTLKHMPAYLLVRMDRTRASRLPGLEPGVIPVEPLAVTMSIHVQRAGQTIARTVRRRQFPITPAYAFTDYRAQGQTIPRVLVDIATPPRGTMSLPNLYVALSRSAGRDTIRILRDFDDRWFLQGHDPELLREDERLEELDVVTKEWWRRMGGEKRMTEAREGRDPSA